MWFTWGSFSEHLLDFHSIWKTSIQFNTPERNVRKVILNKNDDSIISSSFMDMQGLHN